MKLNQYLAILSLLCTSLAIQAQTSAVVYGGIAKLTNQAKLITPDGAAHPGYVIGADAMLDRRGINLMAGFQYHQFHFIATENSAYFGMDEHISYTKLRFGMHGGFELGSNMLLRVYALGVAPLLTHLGRSDDDIPQNNLSDAYIAATGGISFAFGPGVVSLEYEKGFSDVTPEVLNSRNSSLAFTLGFIF